MPIPRGFRHSEESKEKMRLSQLGKKHSEEAKRNNGLAKMGNKYRLGKKHSEETKNKISVAKTGFTHSKESRRKMSLMRIGNKYSLGHRHSEETRRKMKMSHTGEKNWNWKGGITPENRRLRFSLEYKLWRNSVFERDNYTCLWCGDRNGNGKAVTLNADHIKPWALFPELRFAIDNGRTLCVPCHKMTESYGSRKI